MSFVLLYCVLFHLLTCSLELEFIMHWDEAFCLTTWAVANFKQQKKELTSESECRASPMKSFLSVICLSHVYDNVVTGTISIAIISLQLQLPKDYLKPSRLNASRRGCKEER